MAGDKDKKGFSGLSDLASTISEINETIKPEPKEEAIKDSDIYEPIRSAPKEEPIKDSDVKKESREASQSAGVSIDLGRALPTQDTARQRDRGESEYIEAYNLFGLMLVMLFFLGLFFSIFSSVNNAKSDPVLTSEGIEGDSRKKVDDTSNSLMDFPINRSPDSTSLHKDLPQKSTSSQNSQGGVVLPDAKGTFTPKKNESKALAESGRTEEKLLFSGNEKGQARIARVDNGFVVLSDGRRYSITGLSGVDFSHLMRNYDAKAVGFKMPVRSIYQERTWWDRSFNYSRKGVLFAKSGNTIILFSKENKYHKVDYSNLSANDRSYIDSIEFSRPLKESPFIENKDPFKIYHVPDINDPFDYDKIPPLYYPFDQ
jgi:hypothetical protein